jgi:hypothetical protein
LLISIFRRSKSHLFAAQLFTCVAQDFLEDLSESSWRRDLPLGRDRVDIRGEARPPDLEDLLQCG